MDKEEKEKMLNFICGEDEIESSSLDEILWDIYTMRAEIEDRLKRIEKVIWELKRNEKESE